MENIEPLLFSISQVALNTKATNKIIFTRGCFKDKIITKNSVSVIAKNPDKYSKIPS